MKQRTQRLHEYEGPIALQTSVLANINRDPKQRKKPYALSDYALFTPKEDLNLAASQYGAAAIKLIKAGAFPAWALFCYKDLVANADKKYVPENAALVSEDALLLHPTVTPSGVKGLLVAMESASKKARVFVGENGEKYTLVVPEIPTKVVATEDVTLHLLTSQFPLS